jgi:putative ABC transport system permease protein
MNYYFIDGAVIPLSGLTLVAGNNFPQESPVHEHQLIINQKAAEVLGFETATSAVGETVWIEDSVELTIVGVVRDFYNEGVGNTVRPLALRNKAGSYNTLHLSITQSAEATVVADIEKAWKKIYPDRPFNYVWLRKQHEERHAEMGSVSVLGFLAFMAVTIASLGLLGLVVYTVETKRKEISIRKIIGASVRQLMILLSKGFAVLILISGAIAIPVSYVLSELFLWNFANRIQFALWIPAVSFFFLLTIGLSMILSQTYKASSENPVKNLRSE